jgi:hypothetical protein
MDLRGGIGLFQDSPSGDSAFMLINTKNMDKKTIISFVIQPFEGAYSITPQLDGKSPVELVSSFERKMDFDIAGGYGGLIPTWFKYGPLDRYFVGDFAPDGYFDKKKRIYLLGCDCGEVGCWPLSAQVESKNDIVRWLNFRQDHRPERDYSGLGPFYFDSDQFQRALTSLCDEFSGLVTDSDTLGRQAVGASMPPNIHAAKPSD